MTWYTVVLLWLNDDGSPRLWYEHVEAYSAVLAVAKAKKMVKAQVLDEFVFPGQLIDLSNR